MTNQNENIEEMSFEELLNNSFEESRRLEKTVTGTVININAQGEIFVDIGYKADGIIPKSEYSFDENANPQDELKPGDQITADVLKQNDGQGNVLLSYKRAKQRSSKKDFELKVKNEEVIEAKVFQVNENGLIVLVDSIRVFIPYSLANVQRNEDIKDFKDKLIKFKIIEYDPRNRKIIGSVKVLADEEKKQKEGKFWNEVEEGNQYEGTVNSISSYGAFIDIDGIQGLLHVSEMTWERNANPRDILKTNETINVIIKTLDKENKRMQLAISDKGPNPWKEAAEKYNIGDVVTVKIANMMPYGVFVEIEKGIEGLVHISQICEDRITKPEEKLRVGQKVNAKIIDFDKENNKIELSIKDLEGTSNEYIEELN